MVLHRSSNSFAAIIFGDSGTSWYSKIWLPRRALSAVRAAGIVHALEGWTEHECGENMLSVETVWQAALEHGFRPLEPPSN